MANYKAFWRLFFSKSLCCYYYHISPPSFVELSTVTSPVPINHQYSYKFSVSITPMNSPYSITTSTAVDPPSQSFPPVKNCVQLEIKLLFLHHFHAITAPVTSSTDHVTLSFISPTILTHNYSIFVRIEEYVESFPNINIVPTIGKYIAPPSTVQKTTLLPPKTIKQTSPLSTPNHVEQAYPTYINTTSITYIYIYPEQKGTLLHTFLFKIGWTEDNFRLFPPFHINTLEAITLIPVQKIHD